MGDWSNYSLQQKFWLPVDLNMRDASGLFAVAVDSPKLAMPGFKRFAIQATTVAAGGDRSAGSWKLTADLFDPVGVAIFAAPVDLITGINRFSGTVRTLVHFGDRTAIALAGTGAGTVGSQIELIRAPISAIQLHAVADAAFSGGTTNPTSVLINVSLLGQS